MQNKRPDIICFSLFRTDNPYSSISLRLSKVWAKESRVFYINHPYSHKDVYDMRQDAAVKARLPELMRGKTVFETLPEIPENFISITPRLTYPINWLPEGVLYDRLWQRNNQIILDTIKEVIEKYNIKDYVYFNCFNPFYGGWLPKSLGAAVAVYDCIDDISQDPYTRKHAMRLELEAVRKTDVTVCTGIQLQKKYKTDTEHCYLLQNAVEIDTIEKALTENLKKPQEWESAKGRIFGFVGNLDHLRIDYDLLKAVALRFPNDTLALVGPINSKQFYEVGLDQIPNVICSGAKPYNELPRYMQHMDVTLIPFLCNKLTESIYPLKINEYLAAGKPVVSTDFSMDIRTFKDSIYLAQDKEDFLQLLIRADSENTPALAQERLAVAKLSTWEARVRQFWDIIDGYLAPQQQASLTSREPSGV